MMKFKKDKRIDGLWEAEEVAREYNIEMCFGDNYIAVEDDVFYF